MPENYDRARWGGKVGMLRRQGADPEQIAEAVAMLATGQAEAALNRALESAPPLSATQISYLRAVLEAYGSDEAEADQ